MTRIRRIVICGTIVASGLATQAALEAAYQPTRSAAAAPPALEPADAGSETGSGPI